MGEGALRLVTRAQLAEYAGTSRAAVTNWHKRHNDFPQPVDGGRYDLDEVIAWLSTRIVPSGARLSHEEPGTTYGDRVRANVGQEERGDPGTPDDARDVPAGIDRLLTGVLDRLRGRIPASDGALLIATLVYLRAKHPEHWKVLCERAHQGNLDGAAFTADSDLFLPPSVSEAFRDLGTDAFSTAVPGVDAIDIRTGTRHLLTAAFEYTLSWMENEDRRFADFGTPPSLRRTMVDLFASDEPLNTIHDPNCGTGGLLTAAFQAQSKLDPPPSPRVSGTGVNSRLLGITEMNVMLHGIDARIDHPGLPWDKENKWETFDLILTNPPFNLSSKTPYSDFNQKSFRYGTPPTGNTNFAWLQHVISRLSPNGRAGVLMANSASNSTNAKEVAIRSGMIEDGAVECVIALPDRLFQKTTVPVTLWMLKAPTGRCDEVLFIDAGGLGRMTSRTIRTLQKEDTELILRTYRTWRDGKWDDIDEAGSDISHVATAQEIRSEKYSLHPPVYVTGRAPNTLQAKQADMLHSLIRNLDFLESQIPQVDARSHRLLQEAQEWIL
jgi:type I restriction enzyme M protein